MTDVSTLQAMAGRFLATREPFVAWEEDSQRRCEELVKAFQLKALDSAGLQAALVSERTAPPSSTPKQGSVAVLELTGVLTPNESIFSLLGWGTSLQAFMRQLAAASVDASISSVVIVTDSPGGSTRLVSEAAQRVRTVRARKPVVVATTGLNASAAYWITSNASAIAATPSAMVGSIGIVTQRASIVKQLEREGVEIAVITSSKYKSEGHPATKMTADEERYLHSQVHAVGVDFERDVAIGRHTTVPIVEKTYGEGRLLRADDALKVGMIDRVELVEATLDRALSSPAEFTAMFTQRIERQRRIATDLRAEQGRAEIAEVRQHIAAARRAVRS